MTESSISLEQVLEEMRRNNRVCPLPRYWNQFWKMLPERKRIGSSWSPPLPLILAAWYESGQRAKSDRFGEHLRWADAHGALVEACEFLGSLPEEGWLHWEES